MKLFEIIPATKADYALLLLLLNDIQIQINGYDINGAEEDTGTIEVSCDDGKLKILQNSCNFEYFEV
jgi:hypothetical protein